MTELALSTYDQLRKQIREAIATGQERARKAVEQEKVHTCREVGRLLHEHLLEFRERADYGKQLLARLAGVLELGEQRLYEMLNFYRVFPIPRTIGELSFSHYVKLLSLKDEDARNFYLEKATEEMWSVRQLEQAIKVGSLALAKGAEERKEEGPAPVLRVRRGRLFTCRLVKSVQGNLQVDLGFGARFGLDLSRLEGAEAGLSVRSFKEGEGYRLEPDRTKRAKLYTYRALVENIIDGDTVWVEVDCGFGMWLRQKLRLRGIDTPELGTEEGERARAFAVEALRTVDWVVLTTSKPDKYDRYLADLFYLEGEADPERVAELGNCLNQELIDRGLAQPFSEEE